MTVDELRQKHYDRYHKALALDAPCLHLGEEVSKVQVTCCGEKAPKTVAVHECPKKNRALPTVMFDHKGLRDWAKRKPESDLYTLCKICDCRESNYGTPANPKEVLVARPRVKT